MILFFIFLSEFVSGCLTLLKGLLLTWGLSVIGEGLRWLPIPFTLDFDLFYFVDNFDIRFENKLFYALLILVFIGPPLLAWDWSTYFDRRFQI